MRERSSRKRTLIIHSLCSCLLFCLYHCQAALLVTLNVGFCIVEILGFMYALGIVIDSVSVINVVLAVGLSVDYSAHVGHCFMVKGGANRDVRATEALAVSVVIMRVFSASCLCIFSDLVLLVLRRILDLPC